jgi:hypothetical protein
MLLAVLLDPDAASLTRCLNGHIENGGISGRVQSSRLFSSNGLLHAFRVKLIVGRQDASPFVYRILLMSAAITLVTDITVHHIVIGELTLSSPVIITKIICTGCQLGSHKENPCGMPSLTDELHFLHNSSPVLTLIAQRANLHLLPTPVLVCSRIQFPVTMSCCIDIGPAMKARRIKLCN